MDSSIIDATDDQGLRSHADSQPDLIKLDLNSKASSQPTALLMCDLDTHERK